MALEGLLQTMNLKQGVDKVAAAVCDTQVNFIVYMSSIDHLPYTQVKFMVNILPLWYVHHFIELIK